MVPARPLPRRGRRWWAAPPLLAEGIGGGRPSALLAEGKGGDRPAPLLAEGVGGGRPPSSVEVHLSRGTSAQEQRRDTGHDAEGPRQDRSARRSHVDRREVLGSRCVDSVEGVSHGWVLAEKRSSEPDHSSGRRSAGEIREDRVTRPEPVSGSRRMPSHSSLWRKFRGGHKPRRRSRSRGSAGIPPAFRHSRNDAGRRPAGVTPPGGSVRTGRCDNRHDLPPGPRSRRRAATAVD